MTHRHGTPHKLGGILINARITIVRNRVSIDG